MSKFVRNLDALEQITIVWAERETSARLYRTSRRVLKIDIKPGGEVTVFAPHDVSTETIASRCRRKGPWLFRQLDQVLAQSAFTPERRYVSGETHLFMGRPYRLAIDRSDEPFVRIDGTRLIIGAREPDDAADCRRLLTAFYLVEARSLFCDRLRRIVPPFERRGIRRPHLIIRRMSKRWGSYTARGNITLNVDLIRASPSLVDYVLAHELAHAFHADHSDDWRNLLSSVMPDWEERKLQLEALLR